MSAVPTSLFGWDLLYGSIQNDIENNHDLLISLVHLVLINNGFRCIGIGESKTLDGSEVKSEALPRGWNDGYAIRYVHQGRLYNLKGNSLDDGIMINLMKVDERSVSMIQLNTRSVARRTGTLEQMIPNSSTIINTIQQQLIERVVISTKTKDCVNQTQPQSGTSSSVCVNPANPSRLQEPPLRTPAYPCMPNANPVGVGSVDLNPFGINPLGIPRTPGFPSAEGMLFVPSGTGGNPDVNLGIPARSLPPGARFDLFRPPDVDRFPPRRPANHDNDEMAPPGFDDMFM